MRAGPEVVEQDPLLVAERDVLSGVDHRPRRITAVLQPFGRGGELGGRVRVRSDASTTALPSVLKP